MSHLFSFPPLPRRRLRAGAVAASAALAALLATAVPAGAQINGWMNQWNPWGPTYNQHTATNIMTPHMNYTPSVTIPQNTFRQNNFQPTYPQGGYYPQMPSPTGQTYPSYQQYFGPPTGYQYQGNQYQGSQSPQSPIFTPVSPDRSRHHAPTAPSAPAAPIVHTGPGGARGTVYPPIHGGTVTLPGSNIPIRGFGVQTPYGYQNNFPYAPLPTNNGPALLGGYYYGGYTNTYCEGGGYVPSVYSVYSGLPQYIYNVGTGLTVVGDPYYPVYATPYQPFSAPANQVTYNQTNNQYNYYTAGSDPAGATDGGGTPARHAADAPHDGTFREAFGDIERAWKDNDLTLLQRHIRDSDTRISVYFQGKYSYSVASGDFVQITRDAFDRLHTVSFEFTRLRKAKNGDVTAYGKQVYRTAAAAADLTNGDLPAQGETVPFKTTGTPSDAAQPYDKASDPTGGQEKTVYVSYILRRYEDRWDIIGIDTSPTELAK